MEMILYQEGVFELVTVTKDMFVNATRPEVVDCFSLCDIIRNLHTTYLEHINKYIMKDSGAYFYGCLCR